MVDAEIAKLVGWSHWKDGSPVTWEPYRLWTPTTDLNHALQAAEMRWPAPHTLYLEKLHGKTWHFQVLTEDGPHKMTPETQRAYGKGDTPCEAICAAIEAAGPKETDSGTDS